MRSKIRYMKGTLMLTVRILQTKGDVGRPCLMSIDYYVGPKVMGAGNALY